jgi:hypothetical protein
VRTVRACILAVALTSLLIAAEDDSATPSVTSDEPELDMRRTSDSTGTISVLVRQLPIQTAGRGHRSNENCPGPLRLAELLQVAS